MLPKHTSQFQKQARARAAVVRPNEAEGIERFCVVVRAEQKRRSRRLVASSIEPRDEINESNLATRRRVGKNLPGNRPARERELFLDVSPALFDRLSRGRMRTEAD